ncbi:hypothetical protein J6590_049076 [Homalodisca vitripennis]|nr:hypothetical protein J6590_049076 [Homalodisca vitripennis]
MLERLQSRGWAEAGRVEVKKRPATAAWRGAETLNLWQITLSAGLQHNRGSATNFPRAASLPVGVSSGKLYILVSSTSWTSFLASQVCCHPSEDYSASRSILAVDGYEKSVQESYIWYLPIPGDYFWLPSEDYSASRSILAVDGYEKSLQESYIWYLPIPGDYFWLPSEIECGVPYGRSV